MSLVLANHLCDHHDVDVRHAGRPRDAVTGGGAFDQLRRCGCSSLLATSQRAVPDGSARVKALARGARSSTRVSAPAAVPTAPAFRSFARTSEPRCSVAASSGYARKAGCAPRPRRRSLPAAGSKIPPRRCGGCVRPCHSAAAARAGCSDARSGRFHAKLDGQGELVAIVCSRRIGNGHAAWSSRKKAILFQ
jgi:hypothetical protein